MIEYKYNRKDEVIIDNKTYANYIIVNRFNLNCINYYEVIRTLERADTGEIVVELKVVPEDSILKKKEKEEIISLKSLLKTGTLVVDAGGCVYQYIPLKDFDFSFYHNIFLSESRIAEARSEGVFLDAYGEFIFVYDYNDNLKLKVRNRPSFDINEIYYPKKFWNIGEKAIMKFMNSIDTDEDWSLVWKRKPAVS